MGRGRVVSRLEGHVRCLHAVHGGSGKGAKQRVPGEEWLGGWMRRGGVRRLGTLPPACGTFLSTTHPRSSSSPPSSIAPPIHTHVPSSHQPIHSSRRPQARSAHPPAFIISCCCCCCCYSHNMKQPHAMEQIYTRATAAHPPAFIIRSSACCCRPPAPPAQRVAQHTAAPQPGVQVTHQRSSSGPPPAACKR